MNKLRALCGARFPSSELRIISFLGNVWNKKKCHVIWLEIDTLGVISRLNRGSDPYLNLLKNISCPNHRFLRKNCTFSLFQKVCFSISIYECLYLVIGLWQRYWQLSGKISESGNETQRRDFIYTNSVECWITVENLAYYAKIPLVPHSAASSKSGQTNRWTEVRFFIRSQHTSIL